MNAKAGLTGLVNKLVFRLGFILILAGVTFGANIAPAFACAAQPAPSSYPRYTLQERAGLVPYVFSGTITKIQNGDTAIAVVDVKLYYKGGGPHTVKVSGFSRGADCQETVKVGQQAVFFTYGDPTNGLKVTSTLNPSQYVKPTEPITDQFLAEVTQAVGHQPAAPFQDAVITPGQTVKPTVGNGPTNGDVPIDHPVKPGVDVIALLVGAIAVVIVVSVVVGVSGGFIFLR
jgi:hypothetical protein